MGEGAGCLVLEELEHAQARGAHIYAELAGYGMSSDAFHMTLPDETGESQARAIAMALARGRPRSRQTSTTSTPTAPSTGPGDIAETRALKRRPRRARPRRWPSRPPSR